MGAFPTPSWLLPIKLPTFHRLPKRCAERKVLNCLPRIIPYFRRFVAVVCKYARSVQASASPSEERYALSLYPILQPRRKNLTREFQFSTLWIPKTLKPAIASSQSIWYDTYAFIFSAKSINLKTRGAA